MNKTRRLARKFRFALCTALLGGLTGSTTWGQPSVSVGVSVSVPSVQIRAVSDFYEPLAPQGEWVVIGSYGRCWRPRHVAADWRPYCNGHWQRTDDGWYWVSDEPWAWATYHYGRWNFTDQYGWYWVPQTQWAPAWVSWHEGGGYIGWAPLYSSGVRVISPRAYVFVEERHFMDPVRSSTAIAYNTTIINKTVINEAPAPAAIEKASGRKFQAVPVRELRQKEEAPVVARQRTPAATAVKNVQPPVRTEARPNERKAVAAPVPTQMQKSAPVTTESRPAGNHGPAVKEPAGQNANQQPVKQEKSIQPPNTKAQQAPQQPAKEKSAASGNNGAKPAGKGHNDKSKD